MNNMKRIFTLLVLTVLFAFSGLSQKSYINYSKDSRWFFGINGGATWHTRTEVNNIVKGGYGFTFGHSFGMRPEKLFSWDLRFRYLHGWFAGQSTEHFTLDSTVTTAPGYGSNLQTYQDTAGYYIPNFKTQLLSGSIELALNTNRLRENTGWNIQIFGGLGLKGYQSKADLFDGSGNIYDYNSVTNNSISGLLSAQDGNYETYVTGTDSEFEIDWAPSFGVGISYQIAPWVSLGISHKMTWTRSDGIFDLTPNTPAGPPSAKNDIYHYSSAGFKFHLFGGNHTTDVVKDPVEITDPNSFDKPNTNPVVNTTPRQKPIVDIYDPGSSPYTTELSQFLIKAKVHYVDGKQNVSFKQNGNVNNNFSYNATSDEFASTVVLQDGQNIFEITGVNSAGQDYESTIIIYKRPIPLPQPPIVTITNPSYSPYTTNNNTFNLASTVLNVDSKSQIKVYFNGVNLPNFSYSTSTKVLNANLSLLEGTNTVTVTATNNDGSDSKTVQIIYNKPAEILPPVVSYIYPSVDPYLTNQQTINITASVLNVATKNDIKVVLNGVNTTNFNFNTNTKNVTFGMNLIEGANIVEVTGTNQAGSDYEVTTIIYARPEAPKPPLVTFIDPAVDPTTVYSGSYNVTAKVEHVNGPSNIVLKINGVQSYNFAYSTSSKLMTFTTNLLAGSNVIEITGTNAVGQDAESTVIIRKRTVVQAPPVVNITYPAQDNQEFNTPNVTVLASVLNVAGPANINVIVNGNQTQVFSYNTATKALTLPIIMNEGANTVQITGTNASGTDADTRIIIYKKPVVPAPPTVAFVNPPSTPHLVTVENFTMTAATTNIDSKSQISLFFNGNLIDDVNYTFNSNHQIVYNCNLLEGNNVFNVLVNNNDGSADALAIVTYKPTNLPCLIPTVGYIHPVPYSTVNDPNVTIDAQINNHSPETVVELFVNGVSQGFMTYDAGTSVASKATVLNEGSNSVKVKVTNNCGQNQSTFTLNYVAPQAPCIDPSILAFTSTNVTTFDDHITLQAGVSEVTNANSVSATINGQTIPVLFDLGTSMVAISNASLSVGNNTIIITVTNDCGTATLAYYIVREVCHLPEITAVTPTNNTVTTDATLNLAATISHATASQVQLIINGISQPFSFNDQTGALTAAIGLNVGINNISIKATNSCGADDEILSFTREIPCAPLSLNLLTPSTNQASVTDPNYSVLLHVSGTLISSGVNATLNGAVVPTSFDAVAGNVSISNLTLVDGSNTIIVNLSSACSQETITYTVNYDGCQEPTISVNNLTTNQVVNNSTLNLSAAITNSNGAGNIVLTLNGQVQSINFDDQTGIMTSSLNLIEGSNAIVLTVNGCQIATQTLNVTYEVPCQAITYSLMQPAALNQSVVLPAYAITINLQEVENQQQITVSLNGAAVNFTFDPSSHILSIPALTLVDGSNTIIVNANNNCSNETVTYTVQYNGCQAPVINLTSPAANVSVPLYSLVASVTNISNQSAIQVLHNGAPVSFIFSAQTGQISADITLIEGLNTIVVNANGCASDSKTISTTYTIPCDPIVFALSVPAQNTTSVADENYAISLVAQHAAAGNISVSLNGSVVPHTYSNDIISANLLLIDGSNTVVVTMSNACSQETVTYTIEHDGCDAPVINLGNNADASSIAAYNFNASISNIDNQSQLVFTLNGTAVPFTYDPLTDNFTALLTLTEGTNTIVLTANGCAVANANYAVVYTVPCVPVSYNLVTPAQLNAIVDGATTSISLNVQNVVDPTTITATLNGQTANATFTNNIITLSNLNLTAGSNTVVVNFGNACSSESVSYTIDSDQCDGPIISVTNNNVVTNDPLYTFICNVTNIANGNNIGVTINGQTVTSNFNAGSGVLTAQMSLVEGANTVVVTANGCESISGTYNLTYEVPCDPISFSYINPASSDTVFVSNPTYTMNLGVNNVLQSGVSVTLNGTAVNANIVGSELILNTQNLQLGLNTIIVNLTNDCGTAQTIFKIVYEEQIIACDPPVISITSPSAQVTASAFQFTAGITNVTANEIVIKLNGTSVPFTYTNGIATANVNLAVGTNAFSVEANGCQAAVGSLSLNYVLPCNPLTFTLGAPSSLTASTDNASYSINLATTNVTNQNTVSATHNGNAVTATLAQNGTISISGLTLTAGANTIMVNFANDCSNQALEYVITYTPPVVNTPCGPRFNPGNSEWEFCIVTPSGTYNRDNLANDPNFTYTGPATSAYFKPIAGGGTATVNGQPYSVQNGQYYLFQGNLTVDVSSSHPGSMGHWEICLTSDANPTHGNGNNKPVSPCENTNGNGNGNTNGNGNGNNSGNSGGGFTIDPNGTVSVSNDYCTTIKCLGESVVYNYSQEAYVSVQYSIDGGSSYFHLDGGNYVDGNEQTTVLTPDGSDIVIKANCVNQNGGWSNTEISNTGSQYVYVLKNGDQVPNFAPAQGQASLETFLVGYVNTQGLVTIGPNDVIYLFELRFVGNVGIDYQDCVMLITMEPNNGCGPPTDPVVGNKSTQAGQSYTKPTITGVKPATATSQFKGATNDYAIDINVKPVGEPKDVKLVVNGTEVKTFNFDMISGRLTADLKLNDGANTVKIDAVNGSQSTSMTYTINYNAPVVVTTPEPVITSIMPATTSVTVKSSTFAFAAKVENVLAKENIQITLNGSGLKSYNYSPGTNQLSAVLNLMKGNNVVRVVATNETKSIERSYTINYEAAPEIKPVVNDPKITNINPSSNNSSSKTESLSFKAKVEHVGGKNDIKITVNGVAVTMFTYSSGTNELNAVIKLNPGNNIVKIEAIGAAKKVEQTYSISYTPATNNDGGSTDGGGISKPIVNPVVKPVITNISPSGSSETSKTATYMFKAKVTNVKVKNDIQLKLNGVTFTGFTYSSGSNEVTAVLRLINGNNVVQLTAKNGTEVATSNYTISYAPPAVNTDNSNTNGGGISKPVVVPTPVIGNVNPSSTKGTSTVDTYTFKAKLTNVKASSDVKMVLNGVAFSGFSYVPNTGQLTAVLKLAEGANSIQLTVNNEAKSANRTYIITYTPKQSGGGTKTINEGGGGTKTINEGGGGTKTINEGGGTKTINGGGTNTNGSFNRGGGI